MARRTWIGVLLPLGLLTACGGGGESGEAVDGRSQPTPADTAAEGVRQEYVTLEEEVAAEGGDTRSGAWRVAYIVEPAEPWWEPSGGFRPAAEGETHHIEIIPLEAETGRIVPDVPIRLEVLDADGAVVDAEDLSFYHSQFFHYADNFAVPEAGSYTLRATLGAPAFRRHGEQGEEPALAEGVTVTFEGVDLAPEG